MSPLLLLDRMHRAGRLAKATAGLAFLLMVPGAVSIAVAWRRSTREYR